MRQPPFTAHSKKIAKQKIKLLLSLETLHSRSVASGSAIGISFQEKPTASEELVAVGTGGRGHNRSRDLAETASLEKCLNERVDPQPAHVGGRGLYLGAIRP